MIELVLVEGMGVSRMKWREGQDFGTNMLVSSGKIQLGAIFEVEK